MSDIMCIFSVNLIQPLKEMQLILKLVTKMMNRLFGP